MNMEAIFYLAEITSLAEKFPVPLYSVLTFHHNYLWLSNALIKLLCVN